MWSVLFSKLATKIEFWETIFRQYNKVLLLYLANPKEAFEN